MLVLVVDDSISIRNFIGNSITKQGHQVIAVPSGEEALRVFQKEPIDLILMDAEMRGMDGFTTTQKIRELSEQHWVRNKIEQLVIEHRTSDIAENLTISIGIATCVRNNDIGQLVEQADQALYKAKKSGRNQFKVFS